jgi:uncharacterized protein YdhG (YjbR/CyaY superfamily)
MKTIDSYLADVPEPQRAMLQHIREVAKKLIPDCQETISYGIPTLKYKGTYVIYFAAFKDHMSLFPGPRTDAVKDKLKDFKMAKGTIQFTLEKPVPDAIIKELVKMRLAEIDAGKGGYK